MITVISPIAGVRYSSAMEDSAKSHVSELDARGLICPLPVLRARKALMVLGPGELLRVYCTDPAAASDFPAFCQTSNHTLVETVRGEGEQGPEIAFLIRRHE